MSSQPNIQRKRSRQASFVEKAGRLFLDSGTQAIFLHRAAHFLYRLNVPLIPTIIRRSNFFLTGADIYPSCKLGKDVRFIHSAGIIIADKSMIGDNCEIFGQVVLGGRGGNHEEDGAPIIGANTVLCIGAKVLGPVTIGQNVTVAACAVVLSSIPDNCLAAGVPATIKTVYKQEKHS
jgi:serine O-acetyltransferase